ncbi:hypothetical protein CLOM_g19853 [Closterium sp. NIES-68]|nr:hypothetical protein CLOM_g19853 [Closterium sp. NIES-68]
MCKRPDFPADITGDDAIALDFPPHSQSGWPSAGRAAAASPHLTAPHLSMPPFTLHYPAASPAAAAASHAAGGAPHYLDWLACGPTGFLSPVSLLPSFPSPGPLLVPPPLVDASNPASDITARLSASHGLHSPRGAAWTSAAKPAALRRIVSNRASAKRSRQRRQQRLEELEVMAAHLQVDGAAARKGLADATAQLTALQGEQKALLEQVAHLQMLLQQATGR